MRKLIMETETRTYEVSASNKYGPYVSLLNKEEMHVNCYTPEEAEHLATMLLAMAKVARVLPAQVEDDETA